MNSDIQNCCSICFEILRSGGTTVNEKILELLKFLIVNINVKLKNSLICEDCLTKIKAAGQYKNSYLSNSQHILHNTNMEESDLENVICEMCKKVVCSSDCIPFNSATNNLNLLHYLSPDLELKIDKNRLICELCYKSLLTFFTITNLLSIFDEDRISNSENKLYSTNSSVSCNETSITNVENKFNLALDVKGEKDIHNELDNFQLKKENIDVKMESDEEVERVCQDGENKSVINTKDPKVLQCAVCLYETQDELYLQIHMINHSSQEKMLKCEFCEFRAKLNSVLKKHMITHKSVDELSMFSCELCAFQTKRKGCLKKHMLIHKKCDELEMFNCSICNFKTKRKDTLKNHVNIHKKTNEIQLFQCQICNFQTKHNGSIVKHMLIHKRTDEIVMFKCDICEFQSKRKDALKKHMVIHKSSDEVQMFQCQICEFKTKHNGSLKQHMLVHKNPDEIQMFKCQVCKYQTKHNSSLKSHLKIHSKCLSDSQISGSVKAEMKDL